MTVTEKIAQLDAVAQSGLTLMPEVGSTLAMLAKDLNTIMRLDLPRDRRIFDIDLENLISISEAVLAMRGEGQDPEELEAAIVDIGALAADMRSRAVKAIRNAAGEIALSASVASIAVDPDAEPQDLTREFKILVAAPPPAKSDAPGLIVSTPELGAENAFGRITGDYVAAKLPTELKAAPYGAVILPAGAVSRLDPQTRVTLFGEGAVQGDRFDQPERNCAIQPVLLEAGAEGCTIHGPAVLMANTEPAGALSLLMAHEQASQDVAARLEKEKREGDQYWQIRAALVVYLLFSGFSIRSVLMEDSHPEMMAVGVAIGIVLSALPALITGAVIDGYRNGRRKRKILQTLPEILTSRQAYTSKEDLLLRHNLVSHHDHLTLDGHLPGVPYGDITLHGGEALNILPARKIAALRPHDVKVMKPLLALPTPSPTETIIPFAPKMRDTA